MKRILLLLATIFMLGATATNADDRAAAKPQARSLELNEQGVAAVQKGQFEVAEQFFRRAISVDTANLTAVHNLAGMYIQNQRPDQAITLIGEYIKARPNDSEFYAQLGDAYFVKRDSRKARSNYERALQLEPKTKGVAKRVASVCLLEKDFTCAEKMLERAAIEQPNDPQVFSNLTSIYLAKGDPGKAISSAKKSLALAQSGEVYGMLGDAYQGTGQGKRALEAFKRAAAMGYEKTVMQSRIDEVQAKLDNSTEED